MLAVALNGIELRLGRIENEMLKSDRIVAWKGKQMFILCIAIRSVVDDVRENG